MNVGEKIRLLREQKNISQSKLARLAGISNDYMNKIELGKVENIGIQKIRDIAKALGAKEEFLFGGFGEGDSAPLTDKHYEQMPIIGYANAGKSHSRISYDDAGYPVGWGTRVFPKPPDFHDPNGYVVLIKGESMLPMREGWRLVVSPNSEVKDGDDVIVRTADGDVYYKRIQMKGDTLVLKSFNSTFEPIILQRHEILWMHKVWAIYPDHG